MVSAKVVGNGGGPGGRVTAPPLYCILWAKPPGHLVQKVRIQWATFSRQLISDQPTDRCRFDAI